MAMNNGVYKRKLLYYLMREVLEKKILNDRLGLKKAKRRKFANRMLPDFDGTNDIIYDSIVSGKPFALVRPGNGECSFTLEWEEIRFFGKRLYNRRSDTFQRCTSVYGDLSYKYSEMFRRDIADADILAVFPDFIYEEYLAEMYCGNAKWVPFNRMTPVWATRPWTDALKGKKVLVVSPFADFLKKQYEKKSLLFNGEWEFPEFELIAMKSIWYFSKQKDERFSNWFEALDYLFDEIMKYDFDIAILACGPFGINLASMLKRAGKQAIQYSGETQMLFGIKGERWDKLPYWSKYYNDSWIRVSKEQVGISETNAKGLDGGHSYW